MTPALASRAYESAGEMWSATAGGWVEYWADALKRGDTPWDVMQDGWRWWEASTRREQPRWHAPHEIVLESPVARLRDFSQGASDDVVATLVLPPQAGHGSCIVDFSPDQSQIRTIRAAGLTRVWSLDWRAATPETKDAGIDEYLDFIDRSIEHIGGPVNLIGDCQGGWLAAIYAALRPESVNTLTIAGAPIDFHAGEAVIWDYVQLVGPSGDMSFYRWIVERGGGVLKGEHMLNGFILIKPENEVAKQVQLMTHIRDASHLERHRHFETWFKHTQDIPGSFYLWIVEHLFASNELVRGELEVRGETIDLRRIACPLYLMAGAEDHITPAPQVFAAAEYVSTPAAHVTRRTTSGGHLGLFMGGEALREHWPPILAGVHEHSRRDAVRRAAERGARRQTRRREPAIPAP